MTYFQSERYLLRYSDLGKKFGTSGKNSFKKAQHHWYETGSKQTPKLNIGVNYETEKPFKCGEYGEECVCPGRIHLGPKRRLDNNNTIDDLFEMLDFAQATAKTGELTKATCEKHGAFKSGKKWNSKYWKSLSNDDLQCMCEPKVRPEPAHCASEGESCSCSGGNVFFGRKFAQGSTTKLANFDQMLEDEYTAEMPAEDSI